MKRKYTFRLLQLFIILISLFSQRVYAVQTLPEFTAKYTIEKFNTTMAKATYQLSHTEKGYKFTQHTELVGLTRLFINDTASMVSYVDKVGDNLLLKQHSYTQTGREKNRNEAFNILWGESDNKLNGKITGVVRNNKINLQTDTEIWDVLSFQIPLMIEANKNTKEYPYQAILRGKINDYTFTLKSSEKIIFSGKQYKALQLVRSDPLRNRQLHIWLIPALYNIPVIIENYRDGKEHSRMTLTSVRFNNEAWFKGIPLLYQKTKTSDTEQQNNSFFSNYDF